LYRCAENCIELNIYGSLSMLLCILTRSRADSMALSWPS